MTTPEGRVKNVVKALLKKHKPAVWTFWPVQTGYGATTLDCIGSAFGHPFAIETKAPGKLLTDRQRSDAQVMFEAGLRIFVIDNVAKVEKELQPFLDACADSPTPQYLKNLYSSKRFTGAKNANSSE